MASVQGLASGRIPTARKGIVLAGGRGTRLYPMTKGVSKQLLPVYDKPMIFYSLSVLMLAGIRDILIISTESDIPAIERLLGDGGDFGISLSYKVQERPNGIAEAFIIGGDFIGGSPVCLILGDNIFYGAGLSSLLRTADAVAGGGGAARALIFGYRVSDPQRYGIADFPDSPARTEAIVPRDPSLMERIDTYVPTAITEKPEHPVSDYAVVGLYFYPNSVVGIARSLRPSARGELEITDVNGAYLERGELEAVKMPRGMVWLDTGTDESLYQAASFVQSVETRSGVQIACLEEIAFNNGWIGADDMSRLIGRMPKCTYRDYLSAEFPQG